MMIAGKPVIRKPGGIKDWAPGYEPDEMARIVCHLNVKFIPIGWAKSFPNIHSLEIGFAKFAFLENGTCFFF